MHESMHIFGLEHAQTPYDLYGDPTDVMGRFEGIQGLLCPNAPHLYRIGMASTLKGWPSDRGGVYGNLTAANFTQYDTFNLSIPAAYLRDDHMVVVDLSRLEPNGKKANCLDKLFISYRVASSEPTGYDSGLPRANNGTVVVHSYDGLQDEVWSNGKRPTYLASIPQGATWWSSTFDKYKDDVGGRLMVRVHSANSTHAQVALCRARYSREYDCSDGRDDDCDGQRDKCDTDCPVIGKRPARGCVQQWPAVPPPKDAWMEASSTGPQGCLDGSGCRCERKRHGTTGTGDAAWTLRVATKLAIYLSRLLYLSMRLFIFLRLGQNCVRSSHFSMTPGMEMAAGGPHISHPAEMLRPKTFVSQHLWFRVQDLAITVLFACLRTQILVSLLASLVKSPIVVETLAFLQPRDQTLTLNGLNAPLVQNKALSINEPRPPPRAMKAPGSRVLRSRTRNNPYCHYEKTLALQEEEDGEYGRCWQVICVTAYNILCYYWIAENCGNARRRSIFFHAMYGNMPPPHGGSSAGGSLYDGDLLLQRADVESYQAAASKPLQAMISHPLSEDVLPEVTLLREQRSSPAAAASRRLHWGPCQQPGAKCQFTSTRTSSKGTSTTVVTSTTNMQGNGGGGGGMGQQKGCRKNCGGGGGGGGPPPPPPPAPGQTVVVNINNYAGTPGQSTVTASASAAATATASRSK
ncbi:hypothetical protein VOLCADRAFT_91784 [Volvox carteri f. nagariensis]|uniref:Peptidase M11 gametolysin domain-containing protein n=1 Tax=Volvox carteri f. nagariensis TaxID=3068 RepID=D8TXY3_VOLCA|nr:uncharacterized protein VOLCADRAFT_91784 [Volvox carteri f. nagariensis]EFJ47723.1 hypothetical protein VOLCADRAFT_91784 [Volvox carteri f. nagariensis]|eukprot:XP_002951194.1 hypothetical protein VOLCADRAFT_91784 [Volvox carteri f. nagariensis]